MAEFPGLDELLLGGYDIRSFLAGAPVHSTGQRLGVSGLEAQLQLKAAALPQPPLGWPTTAPTDQADLYQKVAQSLAAKLEEHRLQQVQMANALQQLQALQQQQELAHLQQQLKALHQNVPRAINSFQRSRTTDLESLGRESSYDVAAAYAPALEFEHQLAALQHAANPTAQFAGLQRISGVIGQHNLPVRSFSSEHLIAGQRRTPAQILPNTVSGQSVQPLSSSKRPPIRQPSGLGPNGRAGPNGRNGGEGGRRARYAATAKAPSWASEDWHPMKAVIASGAQASSGTGVFLPHLSAPGTGGTSTSTPTASAHFNGKAACSGMRVSGEHDSALAGGAMPPPLTVTAGSAASAVGCSHFPGAGAPAGCALRSVPVPLPPPSNHTSQSPASPNRESSPTCSVESNAMCSTNGGCDPYSRQTTLDFSRGSSHSELDSHANSAFSYLVDTMKVVVEEPEHERDDANEECDFVSLARELAELMSKQVIAE